MGKSKLDRILAVLILLIVFEVIYLGIVCSVYYRDKKLPLCIFTNNSYAKAYTILNNDYKQPEYMPNEYYKNYIDDLLDNRFYLYFTKDLKNNYGLSLPAIRTIIVDSNINNYDYCVAFMHESIHMKEFVNNEKYVAFKTFKILYEDEQLHNVGIWYAINMFNGVYSEEYDVRGNIINYLTNK